MSFQDYADTFLTVDQPTPKASRRSGMKAAFAEGWDWTAFEDIGATAELFEAGHGGYAPAISSEMVSPEDLPTAATEARRRGTMSRVSGEMAHSMAKEAGVKVNFGEGSYTKAAVKIMIDRAVERRRRAETMTSAEISTAEQIAIGFGAGLLDPVNLLAAFIPIASASMVARIENAAGPGFKALARAQVGAVEGAVGSALVEPISAHAATQEGRDYGTINFLQNIAFGTGAGAALRPAAGGIKDLWDARISGRADYPDPPTVDQVTNRLNAETQHAALRRTVEDLVNDRPVSASEVIIRAAAEHPEMAKALKVGAALKRDGPQIDDIVARQSYWVERLKKRSSRKKKTDAEKAEDDYTTRLFSEAGVKLRTTPARAAQKIADYERDVLGAERITADRSAAPLPESEQAYLDELIRGAKLDEMGEAELRGEFVRERAAIKEEHARQTAEIDTLYACMVKG